jgi:hypothetical protein
MRTIYFWMLLFVCEMTFFLRFVSGAGTEYASYTSSPYNQYASSPYAGYSYNPTGTSGLLSRYFA